MWDWDIALSTLPELLRGLVVTLEAVFFGMLLALALGLFWTPFRRSNRRVVSLPVSVAVEFVRSTPLLVQIYFLYYVILPELGAPDWPLLTGVTALGVHYSAYTAEVYRAGIEGVPAGQWRAAKALNMTRFQTYRHVVLPQAIPPVVPALGNYLIAMFKETPILSAITVLELLNRAKIIGAEQYRYLEPLTLVGVIYLLLSLASGTLVNWLERRWRLEGRQA